MNIRETNKGNIKMVLSLEEAKALDKLLSEMTGEDYLKFLTTSSEFGIICRIWDGLRDFTRACG